MELFLTVILFLFLGFWLLGVIGRWSLRWWLAKKQREFQERFGGAGSASGGGSFGDGPFRGFYANFGGKSGGTGRKKRREGEVTVTRTERQSEYRVRQGVGDYVEYEEVSVEHTETTAPGE
ncbi:MAG: hypothetical protein J1E79_06285 [Rikenella sp.]|nr:hypothetical protein [Rikenella sp.]